MNRRRKTGKLKTVWRTVKIGLALVISAIWITPSILVNVSVRGGDAEFGLLLACIASVVGAAVFGIATQRAWASRDIGMAFISSFAFVIFMLFNFSNAVGLAGGMRDSAAAPRRAQNERVSIWRRQQSELSMERSKLSAQVGSRTSAMIESTIREKQLSEPKIWKRTNHCGAGLKDVERDDSAEFCSELSNLGSDLAAALRHEELTKKIGDVNDKLAKIDVDTSKVNPHLEAFTAVIGIFVTLSKEKVAWVGIGLDLLFGVVIEVLAGVAPAVTFYLLGSEVSGVQPRANPRRPAQSEEDSHIENFISECIVQARGGKVQGQLLYGRYCSWCSLQSHEPLNRTSFGRKFTAQGFKKERGSLVHYTGIELVPEVAGPRLVAADG